jgi:multidrug efflux pump subunit AcrA (membrane-fusion protein)
MINSINIGALIAIATLFIQCSSPKTEPTKAEQVTPVRQVKEANEKLPQYQSIRANPETEGLTIRLTGRLYPLEKLQLVSEVQGKALRRKKMINEGVRFRKGENMLQVEDQQFRYNLQAQKGQFHSNLVRIMSQIKLDYPQAYPAWDTYLSRFEPEKPIAALPEVSNDQLRFFLSANGIYASFFNIKSTEELSPKYTLKAPFTGVVTQGSVASGSVVSPGVPLATYSRTDVYEYKTTVSTSDLKHLTVGQKVTLVHTNTQEQWTGTINRYGGSIDPTSQAVAVFIRVSGKNLREGLFLEAELKGEHFSNVVELPIHAINRSNQVHVIEDQMVSLQDVEPLQYRANKVWVSGLEQGQVVVVENITEPIIGKRVTPTF